MGHDSPSASVVGVVAVVVVIPGASAPLVKCRSVSALGESSKSVYVGQEVSY